MSDINLIIQATDSASTVLNRINQNVEKLEKKSLSASGVTKKLGATLIAAGAAFAAFGVVSKMKETIDDMDNLAKRARAVGATTEQSFVQFQIASQLLAEGGLSAQETDRALRNLQTRMAKGLDGNKAYADVVAKLGDSVLDANGKLKSTPELFSAVAIAMQNGTMDITDAQKLLGEVVGPKILGIFEDLESKGITAAEAMRDVAENMSIVELEDAQKAEQFNDALGRLQEGFKQLMIDAIGPLLPMLIELTDDLLANMPAIVDGVRGAFETLQPVFDLIGTVLQNLVIPGLQLLFETLGHVATAIAPLVDQLIPFLAEKMQSMHERIRTVVDAITPLAEAALPKLIAAFEQAKVVIQDVADFLMTIPEKFEAVTQKITSMKDGIVNTFGDMKEGISNATEGAVDNVKGFFDDMAEYLVFGSVVPDMVDAIILEMEAMAKDMDAAAEAGTTAVNNKFDNMANKTTASVRRMKAYEKAVKDVVKQEQTYGDQLDVNKRMLDALPGMYANGQIGIETYSQALNEFGAAFVPMEVKAHRAMSSIKDGFFNMSGQVTDVFFNMFTGVTSAFEGLKSIASMVFQMVAKALIQAYIVKPLLGFMTGGLGFLPFFANGGIAQAGQPAIVGERGPELIVPNKDTKILSNMNTRQMMNGGGGGSDMSAEAVTVNFNLNAIDTQTGVEFLIDNEDIITGVIQDAFNKRGRAGPMG